VTPTARCSQQCTGGERVEHDLDLKKSRCAVPEMASIGTLAAALRQTASADDALLDQGIRLVEALHAALLHNTTVRR
jgi:hypothetical protein